MGYDLAIVKGKFIKDNPIIFGAINEEQYESIWRLAKHHPNWFLERISDVFEDQRFGTEELEQAAGLIDDLILEVTTKPELQLLYKLSAAISMALRMNETLFGIAD